MKFVPFPQLVTPRLVLRKYRPTDTENHHRIIRDPEVAQYMLWEANASYDHAENMVKKILSRYGTREGYRWAIARKSDDSLIGTISLLGFEEDRCSFAYMLARDFWGQGYAAEALKAVFDFTFSQMEAASIQADHFADNPASGAVMRKVGMRCQGTIPQKYKKDGIQHDAILYTITKEEWNQRPGLE